MIIYDDLEEAMQDAAEDPVSRVRVVLSYPDNTWLAIRFGNGETRFVVRSLFEKDPLTQKRKGEPKEPSRWMGSEEALKGRWVAF